MSIIDNISNKGILVEKGFSENEYTVTPSRPGNCACGGYATIVGQQEPHIILDLDGTDTLTYRYIKYTRYRCNRCNQYLQSPDMPTLESIVPKRRLCSDAATVFLIRQLLANPQYNYLVIADKYGISAGLLCKAFQQFYTEIRQKLTPILPCNQFVLYPYKHGRKKMVCVFGTDDKGRIGIIDIIQPDDAKNFLIWMSRFRTHDVKRVVCSIDFLGAEELALYKSTAIINTELEQFAKYIAERLGDTFVAKIHTASDIANYEEYKEQLAKLCDTIPTKRRCRSGAFVDDVKEYSYWYRNRVTYDMDFIESAIKLIKTLKTRKYTDEQIVLCAMFSSPLHRDTLLKTKYAKFIIN